MVDYFLFYDLRRLSGYDCNIQGGRLSVPRYDDHPTRLCWECVTNRTYRSSDTPESNIAVL